jgi:hypothetical protein
MPVLSLGAEAVGCMVPPMDACFPASHWRADVGSGMLRKCLVTSLADVNVCNLCMLS